MSSTTPRFPLSPASAHLGNDYEPLAAFQNHSHATEGAARTANQLSNLTYDTTGAGYVTTDQFGNTYSYDAEGRAYAAGGATYLYDGNGARVAKTVSGTTTLYWPGTGGVLNESNATGTQFAKQVSFAGQRVWSETLAGSANFIFPDHLGSTRVTADAAGTVHDDLDYYPFGDTYTNFGSSPSTEHYLFTGDEKDAETSTSFAQARNLSGSLGRFHRPDPYDGSYDFTNPQSLNRYAYVSNRPTILSDPSGKQCVWDDGSYDDEHDPVTGDVAACQSQGGTWIELGQNADWSPSQNGNLQAVVGNIQSGRWAGVNYGGNYTFYSTAPGQTGLVTATDTGGALTFYGYSPMTGVNAINMGSYSDPNQAAGAAVFSTYILSTLDPNDNNAYIRQLSAQVYGNVTHPFGETYQDACNGYLQLEGGVLTGAFAPEVLGASAGYTSVAATRLSVTNALMGSGMTAAGTMGVCDAF